MDTADCSPGRWPPGFCGAVRPAPYRVSRSSISTSLGGYDVGRLYQSPAPLGVPRDIVSPGVVQVIIQENRWKQTELERPARLELLDDLPGAEVLFVGIGADEVEVELVGKSFGEKVSPPRERFQVKELIFDKAVNGFNVALEGVSSGRDANVLAVA